MKKYGRAEQATDENITLRMRIACWIHKPTDTRRKHLRFVAFLLQHRLRKRASILDYKYSACVLLMLVSRRNIHTRAALIASFLVSQSPVRHPVSSFDVSLQFSLRILTPDPFKTLFLCGFVI